MQLNHFDSRSAKAVILALAVFLVALAVYYIVSEHERTAVRHKFTGCVVALCSTEGSETPCIVLPPRISKVIVEEDSVSKQLTIMVAPTKDACY